MSVWWWWYELWLSDRGPRQKGGEGKLLYASSVRTSSEESHHGPSDDDGDVEDDDDDGGGGKDLSEVNDEQGSDVKYDAFDVVGTDDDLHWRWSAFYGDNPDDDLYDNPDEWWWSWWQSWWRSWPPEWNPDPGVRQETWSTFWFGRLEHATDVPALVTHLNMMTCMTCMTMFDVYDMYDMQRHYHGLIGQFQLILRVQFCKIGFDKAS